MHRTIWLVALLLLPVATAQGPAPGYDDAVSYAVDHVGAQADNATSDPIDYAADLASPQALHAEINHTLYVACWAADDHGVQHEACDPYYTPRGQAAPEQPPQEHNGTADALNATHAFIEEVADAVNDTVADPGSAPSQIQRILDAATGLLGNVAQALDDAVVGILGVLGDSLASVGSASALVADGGLAVAEGLAAGVDWTGNGLAGGSAAATDTIDATLRAAGSGMEAAGEATRDAVGTAAVAVGHGAQDAARSVADGAASVAGAIGNAGAKAGNGVTDAAKATGDAIASAAKAAGDAIADATRSLGKAVTGIFDEPAVDAVDLPEHPELKRDVLDVTGLLE